MKAFYLFSLGCKVNSYENSAVGQELIAQGFAPVEDPKKADVILLNTCSVTATADQKSRQHISKFRKEAPSAVLVVMGCFSQKHAEIALSLGANIVLGAAKRSEVSAAIERYQASGTSFSDVKDSLRHENYEELGVNAFTEATRAYLKIQDGCDNFCSYCYIPTLRGNSRSRAPLEVIKEAESLVKVGHYPEIIIAGIHIGGYGKDLGDGSYRLADLLKDILTACPELMRLRISSIEESEIDSKFLALLKDYPQVVDHLHIPLQSGSSSVLKRMRRKYDTAAFLTKLQAIRAVRPDIAITTDVIAGFPLESDEEWAETMDFCQKAQFAEIHVFPFSSRPGTYAASLPDTDPEVKKARVHELLDLSQTLRESYEKRFYGQALEVLYESFDPKTGYAYGHTSNYLLVKTPSDHPRHGEVEKVVYGTKTVAD